MKVLLLRSKFVEVTLLNVNETGEYINGEYVATAIDDTTIKCNVFPVSGKDMKAMPEGTIAMGDYKMYTNNIIDLSDVPIYCIYNNKKYTILKQSDYSSVSNLNTYYLKQVRND